MNIYIERDRQTDRQTDRHRYRNTHTHTHTHTHIYIYIYIYIPEQLNPSPENPDVHLQSYEPTVLVQSALTWHLAVPRMHSSTSDATKYLLYLFIRSFIRSFVRSFIYLLIYVCRIKL